MPHRLSPTQRTILQESTQRAREALAQMEGNPVGAERLMAGQDILQHAAITGDVRRMEALRNQFTPDGWSNLIRTATYDDRRLYHGRFRYVTPLDYAAMFNQPAALAFLTQEGCDPRAQLEDIHNGLADSNLFQRLRTTRNWQALGTVRAAGIELPHPQPQQEAERQKEQEHHQKTKARHQHTESGISWTNRVAFYGTYLLANTTSPHTQSQGQLGR